MYANLFQKKVLILTLGCKVNQYESDAMLEKLLSCGCLRAETPEEADICIVNTCSVTNMADRKSRQMIHRMKHKKEGTVLLATGCYVQAVKEKLLQDEGVDLIVGNEEKKDIADILENYLSNRAEQEYLSDINAVSLFNDIKISNTSDHTRAYVKIQDGCNNFCSYCIIPYLRGRIRSRSKESVLQEIKTLAGQGIREVVLTGINLSSYQDGDCGLADIILLSAEVEGILRVRLSSLEPRIITDEFLSRISQNKKICPHFHLSLQSACNRTLERMNRKYTIEEYAEKCSLLRKYYDRPAITTDIICGFPGETEEDFRITYENLTRLNLYEMHVFKYSRRKGTVAADMPDQVPESVKNERSEKLIALRNRNQAAFEASFANETLHVLVEEIVEKEDGQKYYRGHTERYIRVDIPCGRFGDPEGNRTVINTILDVNPAGIYDVNPAGMSDES